MKHGFQSIFWVLKPAGRPALAGGLTTAVTVSAVSRVMSNFLRIRFPLLMRGVPNTPSRRGERHNHTKAEGGTDSWLTPNGGRERKTRGAGA
ncbi:hypothetical protein Lesp02_24470 [Lentzea sp. NBRC 105346]|nr:hypothetical protein Lesp02_24470 [Lentzea sp. NBRC 105346]